MANETYYFHKHMLLFKDVLEEIINYENRYNFYDAEDRDFDEHGRYINKNYSNNCYNKEKLYGDYDD
jgi:hypothetical protein